MILSLIMTPDGVLRLVKTGVIVKSTRFEKVVDWSASESVTAPMSTKTQSAVPVLVDVQPPLKAMGVPVVCPVIV